VIRTIAKQFTQVEEFADRARQLHFLYVYSTLESNKHVQLGQFVAQSCDVNGAGEGDANLRDAADGGHGERSLQLSGDFPFDPYQLPLVGEFPCHLLGRPCRDCVSAMMYQID
jgi:hypothetical protein